MRITAFCWFYAAREPLMLFARLIFCHATPWCLSTCHFARRFPRADARLRRRPLAARQQIIATRATRDSAARQRRFLRFRLILMMPLSHFDYHRAPCPTRLITPYCQRHWWLLCCHYQNSLMPFRLLISPNDIIILFSPCHLLPFIDCNSYYWAEPFLAHYAIAFRRHFHFSPYYVTPLFYAIFPPPLFSFMIAIAPFAFAFRSRHYWLLFDIFSDIISLLIRMIDSHYSLPALRHSRAD